MNSNMIFFHMSDNSNNIIHGICQIGIMHHDPALYKHPVIPKKDPKLSPGPPGKHLISVSLEFNSLRFRGKGAEDCLCVLHVVHLHAVIISAVHGFKRRHLIKHLHLDVMVVILYKLC